MSRIALVLALILGLAPLARAQEVGWGNLDALLVPLSPTGAMEAALFLPDTPDPLTATRALGVVYAHIPGSAGSVSIHPAIFTRGAGGGALYRQVSGLFGQSPRDAQFFPERIEVTTTMPGPDDPRCCPTLPVRWSIDLVSGVATRLN
jgi:hypothetical protein